jgi:regulatory protein
LRRRGAPAEVAAEVADDLVARGHVDDASFARQWVTSRAGRGYGAARLRVELRARGVAPAVIAAALSTLGGDDVIARARETARRRLPALRRGRADRVAPRLRDYLLRRGFSTSVVVRIVRETTGVAADD